MATSQAFDQPPRNFKGYGKFTVDLEEQLSKSLVLKLATLFEFSVAEESALASATDPAHDFVKLMKQKGIISEDSIEMLTDALEENGDKGIAGYIRRGFHKNVQQSQESPEGAQQSVNSKRSDPVQKQLEDMTIRVCGDPLSSMHLGNLYNCFTKQRGPSVFSGTVKEESFSHVDRACKQISDRENIETVLENSSAGERQIWTKKLAGLGFQSKSSSTHSTCENWFLYSNTYTKKRRWIDGPVPSTDGDYTHYLAEIYYGGYLYIAMSSTGFDDEMSAGQYIAGSREIGATDQLSHSLKSNTGNKRERSHVRKSMTTSHLGSLETDGDKSIAEIFENQIKGNEDLVPVKLGFHRLRDHIDCFPVSKQKLREISSYLDRVRPSLTTSDGSSEHGVTMVGELQRKLETFVGNVYDGHSLTSTSSITTEYDDVRQMLQGLTLKAAAVNVDRFILPFKPATSDETRRVLLLGRVSAGKSTFGNYMVNGEAFSVNDQITSVTKRHQKSSIVMNIGGRTQKLEVVDAPGFFDPENKNELANTEIDKGRKDSEQIHALIWIIRAIWSEEAGRHLQKFKKKMGITDIEKYIIMVITDMNDEHSIKNLIKEEFRDQAKAIENRVIGVRDFSVGLPDSETQQTREAVMTMINRVAAETDPIKARSACWIM